MIDDLDAELVAAQITPVPEASGLPRNEAFRIAQDFRDASAFTGWPSVDEELWLGPRYVLRASAGIRGYGFVRLRAAVGGGPMTGFAAPLKPDGFDEEADVVRVLEALRAGAPVGDSPAVTYLRTAAPKLGYHPLAASSGRSSVIEAAAGRWFLRQTGPRMLVIEPLPKETTSGGRYEPAGAYGELWQVR